MQHTRSSDALARIDREPELEVALVELVVRLGHATEHAAPTSRLCTCSIRLVHTFSF
jgi:hypothetical protein